MSNRRGIVKWLIPTPIGQRNGRVVATRRRGSRCARALPSRRFRRGDCTVVPYKQIVIAAGEVSASLSAVIHPDAPVSTAEDGGNRPPRRFSAGVVVHSAAPCNLLRAYKNWDFPKVVEPGEQPWTRRRGVRNDAENLLDWGFEFADTGSRNKGDFVIMRS